MIYFHEVHFEKLAAEVRDEIKWVSVSDVSFLPRVRGGMRKGRDERRGVAPLASFPLFTLSYHLL